ncbi:helix-turn-helix domain-containing protein [Curtobacterium sp. YC1]|uniref:helix-turn-helix domain-containing protein n=1 Tax=Curtobacterium sp. YC1 TaxID=2795488 RepID=UPI0018E52FD3|nr:helix-turn-helix domain-containing protein [Curtobacterium sp. YC1]QQD75724.1 helix-turn-helix domain-containing protein [Curtobacterium sp. YC1]
MTSTTMGVSAAERCNDFGWHPRGRIDPLLVAETGEYTRFGVGHAWSQSAGYTLTSDPRRIYLVLTIEGGFEFDVSGTVVPTEPGSLVLFDGEAPTTARTITDTARYVGYLEPTVLKEGVSRFQFGEPIATGGSTVQALTSMTNTLLGTPVTPATHTARRHLALSFEHLLGSVLDDTNARETRDAAAHRDSAFTAALASIEGHFRDPAFSVTRLAVDLAVSPRTLHNTFASLGTTPRREIERRRITEANQLADLGAVSLADLAARSGFTSTRQLTRALNRTPGQQGR